MTGMLEELRKNSTAELRQRDEKIAELRMAVMQLESTIQSNNTKQKFQNVDSHFTIKCSGSPFKVVLPLAAKWKALGALLGVKTDILANIQSEEHDVHNSLLSMLSHWLKQQNPPPTWAALEEAVEMVDPSIAN